MLKLKKTISHLDNELFAKIETGLKKSRAGNFLFLLQAYRQGVLTDEEIATELSLSSNSFYVLKSRLYDRIQDSLSGDVHLNKEDVIVMLHRIPEMTLSSSRAVSMALLLKLEKDLKHFDMHTELLLVYSALKKITLYSDKYFYYSQLFNKHMAYSLSLEKSEEILGNFTRVLGQYSFSRSARHLETLQFLRKGINDHLALNESRQIEVIRNLVEIQLDVFCDVPPEKNSTEENLRNTEKILNDLPESSQYKSWMTALDYLFFEYFRKIGDQKQSQKYFEKVDQSRRSLLLYNTICLSSQYLISRIIYLQETSRTQLLSEEDESLILFDEEDTNACVTLGIYKAMIRFYRGNYKEGTAFLNNLINFYSFKEYFHISTDIKLSLVFFYLHLKEYEIADNLLKNIQRKIKTEKLEQYSNILDLIKVMSAEIRKGTVKSDVKQEENYLLFTARNKNERKISTHLVQEFNKRYI